MRYELTDHEWTAIKPMLPNKPRGVPRRLDQNTCASAWSLGKDPAEKQSERGAQL
jgi:transposase